MKSRPANTPTSGALTAARLAVLFGVTCVGRASLAQLIVLQLPIAIDEMEALAQDAFDEDAAATDAAPFDKPHGTTETFRERYEDGKIKVEREVTLDAEGNYVNHGAWRMWDPAGALVAEGQYDMDRRVGSWTRTLGRDNMPLLNQAPFSRFKTPFVSQAFFKNDQMDGQWVIIDADQRKCSQVALDNGTRHGLVTLWMPNGKILMQSRYDQGVPVGDVLQANSVTGELERSATFVDGRRVTTETTYQRRSREKKTEEMFLAPKTVQTAPDRFWDLVFAQYESVGKPLRHGASKSWHPNGQLQWEGQYRYDKRVEHFKYWHPNGQLAAEGSFADDEYDGEWLWWHANGQKGTVGSYRQGRLEGEWLWWNEEGRLASRKFYDGAEAIAGGGDENKSAPQMGKLSMPATDDLIR